MDSFDALGLPILKPEDWAALAWAHLEDNDKEAFLTILQPFGSNKPVVTLLKQYLPSVLATEIEEYAEEYALTNVVDTASGLFYASIPPVAMELDKTKEARMLARVDELLGRNRQSPQHWLLELAKKDGCQRAVMLAACVFGFRCAENEWTALFREVGIEYGEVAVRG